MPTVAIESGFEKNPQMIMWDPETLSRRHRHRRSRHDGIKIRYFGGAAYMDFFTSTGHPVGRPGRRLLHG